jgi:hypothetical protein
MSARNEAVIRRRRGVAPQVHYATRRAGSGSWASTCSTKTVRGLPAEMALGGLSRGRFHPAWKHVCGAGRHCIGARACSRKCIGVHFRALAKHGCGRDERATHEQSEGADLACIPKNNGEVSSAREMIAVTERNIAFRAFVRTCARITV